MNWYQEIRGLARQQAAALEAGDLAEAVRLLDRREELVNEAGEPLAEDEEAIRETLRLDRALAGAIRQHMLTLREEALHLKHARTAVSAYRPPSRRDPRMLDTQR